MFTIQRRNRTKLAFNVYAHCRHCGVWRALWRRAYPGDDQRRGEVRAAHQPQAPVGVAAIPPEGNDECVQSSHLVMHCATRALYARMNTPASSGVVTCVRSDLATRI